jgi:hypothetical protein
LFPHLLQEGFRALTVRRFVIDDLASEAGFRIGREAWGVANLLSEKIAYSCAGPDLLRDDRRTVRRQVVRRFGLRDIMKSGVRLPAAASVTARTPGDLTPGIFQAAVTTANAAEVHIARPHSARAVHRAFLPQERRASS